MPTFGDVRHFIACQFFGHTTLPHVSLRGQTFIVTGGNTGLGFEASKHLAAMGASRLILAVRSVSKGEAAAATLRERGTKLAVDVWQVDLDSYASVSSFCARVRTSDELPRLDGVVLNAGVHLEDFGVSEGLERTVNINVVSTFMMALGVLPKLQETAAREKVDTNMTIVGSLIHVFGADGQLDTASGRMLEGLSEEKTADMKQRYPLSKLMVHMCFNEMVKELGRDKEEGRPKVVMNLVNPGWCKSELARYRDQSFIERIMASLIQRTGEEGSRTLVHGVTAGRETHGCYLSECVPKDQSSFVRSAKGTSSQQKLWKEVAERIQKMTPDISKTVR